MMETKYYQLRERAGENNNIGVIKVVNGHFDIGQIETALTSHFDEEVSNIDIIEYGWNEVYFEFDLCDRDEREVVDGELTWLYF